MPARLNLIQLHKDARDVVKESSDHDVRVHVTLPPASLNSRLKFNFAVTPSAKVAGRWEQSYRQSKICDVCIIRMCWNITSDYQRYNDRKQNSLFSEIIANTWASCRHTEKTRCYIVRLYHAAKCPGKNSHVTCASHESGESWHRDTVVWDES